MPDILQLQRTKAEALKEMRAAIKKADEEKRNLTEEEISLFSGKEDEVKLLDEQIKREQNLQELEAKADTEMRDIESNTTTTETRETQEGKKEERGGFEGIGEFFYTIAENRSDPRLQALKRRRPGEGEGRTSQQMGIGALGGFAMPEQFWNEVKAVSPQEALIRPRATVIPAGSPPDAKITVPTLDQSAAQNIYGGITIQHAGEKITLSETNLKLRRATLEPKKLAAYAISSNELLINWQAAGPFLQGQMRKALVGAEDYDFLRGNGANRAVGLTQATCRIDYSRATASTIVYADVVGMFARVKMGGALVWLASQTTIPQLANIRDTGNNNLWIQNARDGIPSSMFGFPVLWNERAPGLGTAGDLILADISYYLVKDGSGPRVDISKDVLFSTDETAFRVVWYVDGTPWLNNAIGLEGSTSDTVSPFVILN